MMDKNPNDLLSNNLNFLFFNNSFEKTKFLHEFLSSYNNKKFFLDFDLLFSGFNESGIISIESLEISKIKNETIQQIISDIIKITSSHKSLIIIDSLNGFFNLKQNDMNYSRLIYSYIMLLASIAKTSDSKMLITGIAKLNEKSNWVMQSTSQIIFTPKNSTKIQIKKLNPLEFSIY